MILALFKAWVRSRYLTIQCRIIGHIWARCRMPAEKGKEIVKLYQDMCLICGALADA